MAAIYLKRNSFVTRIKPHLLSSQLLCHTLVEVGTKPRPRSQKDSAIEPGKIDISTWKRMDSRSLGITRLMVPSSPYTLIKILRNAGFESYFVGGCVRDLILKRTPKDFDVITTADLNQVKKQFHRCIIVGRRFPICRVHIKGSVIEVSSFKTLAKQSEDKEKFLVSQIPGFCDKFDHLRKNSIRRDFTVNSLFFDPLNHKIYDYNNGMKDLLERKLRTLVPAHVSFTEDCARILRGLRIAARLGLSFSKDIETAIHDHSSSILTLSTSRIMMEMDYMLSFGAAESSLCLLHRFHILTILLPIQAVYISKQTTESEQVTMMLMDRLGEIELAALRFPINRRLSVIFTTLFGMYFLIDRNNMFLQKLFSHMDKLVSCDHPSTCCLWIGLLAFHLALLNKPQHPFVVLTFGCVLYHQSWEAGLRFARKNCQTLVSFVPETLHSHEFISDDEVAKKVNELAMLVIDSIDDLVDTNSLHKTMSIFPDFSYPGLVFVSKSSAHSAVQLFHVLSHKLETYNKGRSSFEMNHQLLGKGDACETRFALGKIIMKTMGCWDNLDDNNHHRPPENVHFTASDSSLQKSNAKSRTGRKQNADTEEKIEVIDLLDTFCPKIEGPTIEKPEETSAFLSPTQKSSDRKKQKLNTKSSNSKKLNAATKKPIKDNAATGPTIKKPEETSASQSQPQKLSDRRKQKLNTTSSNSKKLNAATKKAIKDIAATGPTIEKPKETSASQSPTQVSINSKKQNLNAKSSNSKKLNAATKKAIKDIANTDHTIKKSEEICVSNSPIQEPCLHNEVHNITEKLPSQLQAQNQNPKNKVHKVAEVQVDQLTTKEQSLNRKHKQKQVLTLSSLFK